MPRTLFEAIRPHRRPTALRLRLACAALVVASITALPVDAAAPDAAAETAADAPSVTATESLGGLRIGAGAAAVERLLGAPKSKGKAELWGADGLYHRDLDYPAAGSVIGMSAPAPRGPWEVAAITLKPPAVLKTARGIGIGATRKEVTAAYGADAQPGDAGRLIVGSEFDGLMFSFDRRGRVDEIFLGAVAE